MRIVLDVPGGIGPPRPGFILARGHLPQAAAPPPGGLRRCA
jgi:hypothetical protein